MRKHKSAAKYGNPMLRDATLPNVVSTHRCEKKDSITNGSKHVMIATTTVVYTIIKVSRDIYKVARGGEFWFHPTIRFSQKFSSLELAETFVAMELLKGDQYEEPDV